MPLAHYFSFSDDSVEAEAGVPVGAPLEETELIKNAMLPGGRVAVMRHLGPYEQLTNAYQKLGEWFESNGHTCSDLGWEVYVTDPGAEPDPAKWITEIYRPID